MMLGVWIEVSLAVKLEEVSKSKRTTGSAIAAQALEHFLAEHQDVIVDFAPGGNRSNRDGKDEAALDIVRANLDKTIPEIQSALGVMGIKRSHGWVSKRRATAASSTKPTE